jgi:hypothetical protein
MCLLVDKRKHGRPGGARTLRLEDAARGNRNTGTPATGRTSGVTGSPSPQCLAYPSVAPAATGRHAHGGIADARQYRRAGKRRHASCSVPDPRSRPPRRPRLARDRSRFVRVDSGVDPDCETAHGGSSDRDGLVCEMAGVTPILTGSWRWTGLVRSLSSVAGPAGNRRLDQELGRQVAAGVSHHSPSESTEPNRIGPELTSVPVEGELAVHARRAGRSGHRRRHPQAHAHRCRRRREHRRGPRTDDGRCVKFRSLSTCLAGRLAAGQGWWPGRFRGPRPVSAATTRASLGTVVS